MMKKKRKEDLPETVNHQAQNEIAYVVCRTPKHYKISDRIIALPWQNLHEILSELH
jgi:hypothetical protein